LRFVIFFAACVLLAAILSPWLYMLVHWAGGKWDWPWLDYLARHPFHRYFNRTLQVSILLGIWMLLRRSGFNSLGSLGLKREGACRFLLGGFVWSVIFLGMYALTLCWGGWQQVKESLSPGDMGYLLVKILVTAALVGFLEEIFFRGYFYQLCRREFGRILAIGLNMLFFSTVHFVKPSKAGDLGAINWDAGFRMLSFAVDRFMVPTKILSGLLILAFLAWMLCWVLERTRSIYLAIGLHAGWVFALQLNAELTRYSATGPAWILGGGDLSQGLAGLLPLGIQFICLKWWMDRGGGGKQEAGSRMQ